MHGLERERLQDEHVKGALHDRGWLVLPGHVDLTHLAKLDKQHTPLI